MKSQMDDKKVLWNAPASVLVQLLDDGTYVATVIVTGQSVLRRKLPTWLGLVVVGVIDHAAYHYGMIERIEDEQKAADRADYERFS